MESRRHCSVVFFAVAVLIATGYLFVTAFVPMNGLAPVKVNQPRAAVPNGGLIVDVESLSLGTVWESDQWISRDLELNNPWDYDIHMAIEQWPCGFQFHPRSLTIPAQGAAVLNVAVLPSTRDPTSRVSSFDCSKSFTPIIDEFPGRHPGWTIHCRVRRAMAINKVPGVLEHVVSPLCEIDQISVSDANEPTQVSIRGPDGDGDYRVTLDPSTPVAGTSWQPLSIRARLRGGGDSERYVYGP
jgi:hypothetical protein